MRVDIGIACAPHQISSWWVPLMRDLLVEQKQGVEFGDIIAISSALPDHNKNHTISSGLFANPEEKRRNDLTDANRATIAGRFLDGGADWLWFIDDDTVPPRGALSMLLKAHREFIAGVYFNPAPPHNPIAYMRRPDGLYQAFYGYPAGTLVQVDSVGMGCTLIHRSVFERIQAEHEVFMRPDGSLVALPLEKVYTTDELPPSEAGLYSDGHEFLHVQPLRRPHPEDSRAWPFFALEYGRSEDHHFCELAANVGIKPWLDTTIHCAHFKHKATTYDDYKQAAEAVA